MRRFAARAIASRARARAESSRDTSRKQLPPFFCGEGRFEFGFSVSSSFESISVRKSVRELFSGC